MVGIFLVTPAFGFAGAVVLKQLSNDGQSGFLYGALLGSIFPMLVLWLGTTWPWYWRLCSLIGTVVFASVAGVAFPIFIITQAMSKWPSNR